MPARPARPRRDPLLTKLLDARERFESKGRRFVASGLGDLELDRRAIRSEVEVLLALLEACQPERDALIAYGPRDPESPFFEVGADLILATPGVGCLLIEVKSHPLIDLDLGGGRLLVRYRGDTKDAFRQVRRRVDEFLDLSSMRRRKPGMRLPVSGVVALPSVADLGGHLKSGHRGTSQNRP